MSSVYPSGAAFATVAAPMVPPAPPWFSTSTGWPIDSCMRCATRRATMSVVPPAGNGTMMRSGFEGNDWPKTTIGKNSSARRSFFILISLVGLDVRLLDELRVLAQLPRDQALELRDRHRQRVAAELLDLLAHLRR